MKLTLLITQGTEFLMGSIKEIPAVITQGTSVAEVKENILDALELYLEDYE
jgi:predicted RNase H-like HicB family nuclease